jgi:hypothetical protein
MLGASATAIGHIRGIFKHSQKSLASCPAYNVRIGEVSDS